MNILGKTVTLRAMTMDDMPLLCDMFNDPEIESMVVGWAFPLSLEQQIAWYKAHMGDRNDLRFVIDVPGDGAVGVIILSEIDWKNRSAECGIKLARKENRGKGIGTDAVMAILRHAFDELDMRRIACSILEKNKASRATFRKCGFVEEGVKREYVYKGGSYHDMYCFSILEREYRELIKNNHYWDA